MYYLCKYSGKFCVLQKSCKTKLFLTQKCVINIKIREKICLFATQICKKLNIFCTNNTLLCKNSEKVGFFTTKVVKVKYFYTKVYYLCKNFGKKWFVCNKSCKSTNIFTQKCIISLKISEESGLFGEKVV